MIPSNANYKLQSMGIKSSGFLHVRNSPNDLWYVLRYSEVQRILYLLCFSKNLSLVHDT